MDYWERATERLDEFDPNAVEPKPFTWATYAVNRRPAFKLHRLEHHAKSAMSHQSFIKRYKYDGDKQEWIEVERKVYTP